MNTTKTAAIALSVFAILGAMSGQAMAEGDAVAGAKVFKKCMACHKIDGPNGVGPSLNGIVDSPIGAVEGFKYSKAMLAEGAAGKVWDTATLSAYLANPRGAVPGNKMTFIGLKKPQEQADVIAYIQSESK